eukprot:scaffold4060_cov190-Amphora_coffeaeformis.AAC.2
MDPPESKSLERGLFKNLRLAEPDLRVIVGSDETKEYLYHSVILAVQSTYVDTMLASPMKESKEKVVHFPDLDPTTWESMIKFLDPLESRSMTRVDAEQIATAYDKYDFDMGRTFCDIVLSNVFKSAYIPHKTFENRNHVDNDGLVDMLLLARGAHLSATVEAVHMEKLQQFVKEYNMLPEWAPEMIALPSFPEDFIKDRMRRHYILELERISSEAVGYINVTGASIGGNIHLPQCQRDVNMFISTTDLSILDTTYWICISVGLCGGWDNCGRRVSGTSGGGLKERIFWRCPCSSVNKVLPPRFGWIPVDPAARGEPVIEYVETRIDYNR